jgi:hypothetical protein
MSAQDIIDVSWIPQEFRQGMADIAAARVVDFWIRL